MYTIFGDANLTKTVDIGDYNTVVRNFGATGASWDQGNFYYETSIGLDDYNTVVRNFGIGV